MIYGKRKRKKIMKNELPDFTVSIKITNSSFHYLFVNIYLKSFFQIEVFRWLKFLFLSIYSHLCNLFCSWKFVFEGLTQWIMSSMQSHWRKICQIGYQKLISIKKKKKKKKKFKCQIRFLLGWGSKFIHRTFRST